MAPHESTEDFDRSQAASMGLYWTRALCTDFDRIKSAATLVTADLERARSRVAEAATATDRGGVHAAIIGVDHARATYRAMDSTFGLAQSVATLAAADLERARSRATTAAVDLERIRSVSVHAAAAVEKAQRAVLDVANYFEQLCHGGDESPQR